MRLDDLDAKLTAVSAAIEESTLATQCGKHWRRPTPSGLEAPTRMDARLDATPKPRRNAGAGMTLKPRPAPCAPRKAQEAQS